MILGITAVSTKVVPKKCESVRWRCRLALWVERVWLCLNEFQGDSVTSLWNGKAWIHVMCCFLPPRWNTLRFNQTTVKTTITHNSFRHCRVRFSTFTRQPYSKQLYVWVKYIRSLLSCGESWGEAVQTWNLDFLEINCRQFQGGKAVTKEARGWADDGEGKGEITEDARFGHRQLKLTIACCKGGLTVGSRRCCDMRPLLTVELFELYKGIL